MIFIVAEFFDHTRPTPNLHTIFVGVEFFDSNISLFLFFATIPTSQTVLALPAREVHQSEHP